MHEFEDLLPLTQAAKLVPGRPSSNCLWRWARRGVLSRAGNRVFLKHVRVGGKMYTRKEWVDAFGEALAQADAAYFQQAGDGAGPPPVPSGPKRRRQRFEQHRRESIREASSELEDAGL